MTEKAIVRKQGNLKVVICRPSIIASSIREPYPGWTDSMSAAGGITILGGLGMRHYMHIEEPGLLDIIPVDIVSNSILIGACRGALLKPNQHIVYHCGTSFRSPLTIMNYMTTNERVYDKIKLDKNQKGVWGKLIKSKDTTKIYNFFDEKVPLLALKLYGKLT